ncbi:cytochrome c [Sphingomonas sp. HITSZ_GF]|uniref:c-type cytochrome n=1 Tax=Sphingomonas sp. HITSZ_GF TaxID=3037247 RepID=UPI00240D6A38|nr:cytochrome c [Sphingomonas sp. HITSZ_GF]MDG2535673.1 cytochrome c [Sphingomonas sp. HITSZ_GF]
MRIHLLALGATTALLTTAAATAHGSHAVPAVPAAADPTADVIAGRKAAFLMSAALVGQIKAGVERGDDPKTLAFAARALSRWASALPGLFPAGSTAPDSDALPAIWSDRAGFEAKAADYAAATAKLADLAKAGDKPGFAAQFAAVGATCKACHDSYRKPQAH